MTTTNVFLDLLSSPSVHEHFNVLRSEAATVFQTNQDWDDPSLLQKLVFADSTIRESLRKNPVLTRALMREVICKEGLDLPDGHHIPQGAWLGVPTTPLHHDERFYSKPESYDPFRFVERAVKPETEDKAKTEHKTRKLQGLSTTTDTFVAFGHGRHSW